MADYEELFPPGHRIIVETDDTMKMGVVGKIMEDGVALYLTHSLGTTGEATKKDEERLVKALGDTSTKLLRVFVREAGYPWHKVMFMKRPELIRLSLQDALQEFNNRSVSVAMIPNSKAIPQWIPMERIKDITDSDAFMENAALAPLDFETPELETEVEQEK